jgi:hypothetical protein
MDRGDIPMRNRTLNLKGILGRHQRLAPQHPPQHVNGFLGQRRQIRQRLFPWPPRPIPVRPAQQL